MASKEEKRAEVRNYQEEQRVSFSEPRSCLFEQFRVPWGCLGYILLSDPETNSG